MEFVSSVVVSLVLGLAFPPLPSFGLPAQIVQTLQSLRTETTHSDHFGLSCEVLRICTQAILGLFEKRRSGPPFLFT
jgi:hypothetical protein